MLGWLSTKREYRAPVTPLRAGRHTEHALLQVWGHPSAALLCGAPSPSEEPRLPPPPPAPFLSTISSSPAPASLSY